jgi:hypothetical protein
MGAPANIRATAGFRNLRLYELNSSYYPIGLLTLEPVTIYASSGSNIISGSPVSVAAGVSVSGSIPYYGIVHSGARVLTVNDPTPRVISHVGDDGVFAVQLLPPTEVMSGELTMDKTNDIVDAIVSNVKKVVIGETKILQEATDKRGFEPQVCGLAYSYAQDNDPNSANFGATLWDWRMFPKATVFMRESGYGQEANQRQYAFTPMFCSSYPWGVQFTNAIEGAVRSQAIRGVGTGKPMIVSYLGNGASLAFPFDSANLALSTAKISVWVNGVLQSTGIAKSIYGISFAVAPTANAVIVVYYEA